jgi:cyclic lactone autoinducer peptide
MLKKLIYSPLVLASIVVAALAVSPASMLNLYQPAPPKK